MIPAFVRFYDAWHDERKNERVFRNYVADALRLTTENTANLVHGQYLTKRYAELIAPKKKKQEEKQKQTAMQIADDIISRLHE